MLVFVAIIHIGYRGFAFDTLKPLSANVKCVVVCQEKRHTIYKLYLYLHRTSNLAWPNVKVT